MRHAGTQAGNAEDRLFMDQLSALDGQLYPLYESVHRHYLFVWRMYKPLLDKRGMQVALRHTANGKS